MYFKSTNKQVVEAAIEYQNAYTERRKAIFNFAEKYGSDQVFLRGSVLEFGGVYFNRAAPAGWTKPDHHGSSRPKKVNREVWAEINAFPKCSNKKVLENINFPLKGIICNSIRIGESNFLFGVSVIPVAGNTAVVWGIQSKFLHNSWPKYIIPEDAQEIMESEYIRLIKTEEQNNDQS